MSTPEMQREGEYRPVEVTSVPEDISEKFAEQGVQVHPVTPVAHTQNNQVTAAPIGGVVNVAAVPDDALVIPFSDELQMDKAAHGDADNSSTWLAVFFERVVKRAYLVGKQVVFGKN
jgi:hypothetical protein